MRTEEIEDFSKGYFQRVFFITSIIILIDLIYYLVNGDFFRLITRIFNNYNYSLTLDYFLLVFENFIYFLFILLIILNIKHIVKLIQNYYKKEKYNTYLGSISILNFYSIFLLGYIFCVFALTNDLSLIHIFLGVVISGLLYLYYIYHTIITGSLLYKKFSFEF